MVLTTVLWGVFFKNSGKYSENFSVWWLYPHKNGLENGLKTLPQ